MAIGTTRIIRAEPVPSEEGTLTTIGMERSATALAHRADLRGVESDADLERALSDWRQAVTVEGSIARFVLGNRLGQGSQGAVFAVRDRDCNRVVALKSLLGRCADPDDVSRFLHEVQVTAQLEHPGVVPVHDFGILPDGTVFYTMKRVEGRVLGEWLQGRAGEQTSRFELIQLFLRISDTVAFAHSRGVVHRDLKPRNIMVGNYGEVLVLDWGLAKVLGGEDLVRTENDSDQRIQAAHDHETMKGTSVGTPAYMSPEQARGETTTVDHRADIYALGVLLYEMLAGASPYIRGEVRRTIEQVANGRWTPLDRQPACRNLPRRLVAIVHKAMALQPDQRYQHVSDMAIDIKSFLAGEAVSAYRESPAEVLARIVDRHRRGIVWGSIALLLASTVSGAAWWWVSDRDARAAERLRYDAGLAVMRGDLRKARDLNQSILGLRPKDPEAMRLTAMYDERLRQEDAAITKAEAQARISRENRAEAAKMRSEAAGLSKTDRIPDLESAVGLINRAKALHPGSEELDADWNRYAKRLVELRERERTADEERNRLATALDLARTAEQSAAGGDIDDAVGKLRSSLALVPDSARLARLEELSAKRLARAEAEKLRLREEEQQAAAARRRSDAERELGQVAESLDIGEPSIASDHLERAAGLSPEHPDLSRWRERVDTALRNDRQHRAEGLVEQAALASRTAAEQCGALAARREDVRRLSLELAESGDASRRTALAQAEDACAEAQRRRAAALTEAVAALNRALALAAEHPPVRAALARFWVERLREADGEGDSATAAAAEAQAKAFDDGSNAELLAGIARLVNRSGRKLTVARIVRREDRTDQPVEGQDVAINAEARLGQGRYLVTAADGVRLALRLARGATLSLELPRPPADLPTEGVFIPGGTWYGEDSRVIGQVKPFVLLAREITCGEYIEFLNDPATLTAINQSPELIRAPRADPYAQESIWRRSGMFVGGQFVAETVKEGIRFDPDSPVGGITQDDARAYAAWRARKDGRPWRLPEVAEWQFAVQGGDGRAYPWGDAADLAFCASGPSAARDEHISHNPARRFPTDRSVQGVWDLAGSHSEWCACPPGLNPTLRPLLGGAINLRQPERFTAWSRTNPDRRVLHLQTGFRLAYTP